MKVSKKSLRTIVLLVGCISADATVASTTKLRSTDHEHTETTKLDLVSNEEAHPDSQSFEAEHALNGFDRVLQEAGADMISLIFSGDPSQGLPMSRALTLHDNVVGANQPTVLVGYDGRQSQRWYFYGDNTIRPAIDTTYCLQTRGVPPQQDDWSYAVVEKCTNTQSNPTFRSPAPDASLQQWEWTDDGYIKMKNLEFYLTKAYFGDYWVRARRASSNFHKPWLDARRVTEIVAGNYYDSKGTRKIEYWLWSNNGASSDYTVPRLFSGTYAGYKFHTHLMWYFDPKTGKIHFANNYNQCLDGKKDTPMFLSCDVASTWTWTEEGMLKADDAKRCLERTGNPDAAPNDLKMGTCEV